MATETFLAMTAAEIHCCGSLPPKIGWMACHFSPEAPGLTDLPTTLPPDSLLILDDSTPFSGHSESIILTQLREYVEKLNCQAVLLDFQRPYCPESLALAKHLSGALPCPVAVSEAYAKDLACPVFLSPLPHHIALKDHLAPWQGRQLWLELALDGEIITVTESGATIAPLPPGRTFTAAHKDQALHCHYRAELSETEAKFTLWRTRDDLDDLLIETNALGINHAVGLFQELGK